MKKFRGKALAALLSLALIASSFPVTLASASTKHATGVLTDDPDNDEFWLVNGGDKDERSVANFQDLIYSGTAPLETADHQDVDDAEVYSISHVSGDKLVSWDIGDDNNDDEDEGDVTLKLRKSDSEGDEVLAILYKGTYTDDDDNDIDVTASTQVTIHAVDKNSTVIGDASDLTATDYYDYGDDPVGTDSPELDGDDDDDDNFAKVATAANDSKKIAVFRAEKAANENNCLAQWKALPTVAEDKNEKAIIANTDSDNAEYQGIYYVLEGGNDDSLDVSSTGLNLVSDDEMDGVTVKATGNNDKVVIANTNSAAIYYTIDGGTVQTVNANVDSGEVSVTAGQRIALYSTNANATAAENEKAAYYYRSAIDQTGETEAVNAKVTATHGTAWTTDVEVDPKEATTTDGSVKIHNGVTGSIWYSIGTDKPTEVMGQTIAQSAADVEVTIPTGKHLYVYTTAANPDDANLVATYDFVPYQDATQAGGTGYSDYVYATVKDDAKTANISFKAKVTDNHDGKDDVADDDDIKSKVKVEKKVLANDVIKDADASYTIAKDDKKYTIKLTGNTNGANPSKEIDSGFSVKFATTSDPSTSNYLPNATIADDASVDGVKGKVNTLTVDDAKKVGAIDLKAGNVNIDDADVKVDSITSKESAKIKVDSDNNVGDIKIKDDTGDSEITMSSGSAKSITSKGVVSLEGSEDDEPISVGTLSAREITLDSDDGAVSVEKVVSNATNEDENGCSIELIGDNTTVKAIDFVGFGTDLKTTDFQGTIPAPANATSDDATFETTDEDDDVTVTGDADINAVTIEEDSKVVFEGKLSVDSIDGSGTMYIGANKLYVDEDATGVLVKVTDNTITAGSTIFTAASDAVDEDDLDFYGFTVKCNEGKSTDTFVVDQLQFAGLAMNKTSDKIVLNESATYTASAYAPGTSIPEGYSIEFDIEDNSGVFELTDNGNGTATVKCVDFDDVFSDENKATLEAYVVDEDGDEDDDYGMAETSLTALKTPEKTFTSDTNNDFTLASGASYQFKITDAAAAPVMTAGTAGIVDIANVGKSGNDYFIKVTAKGAANAKTGIYVNGTKLLVITVGGVVCDTTKDITVKKGASYQYKVTASAAPTFGFGTAGVFTSQLVSHSGNNYFYKVTAVGAAGASTGVYVNGQKVNIAKVG
ncbi:hypothetical protein [Caproicibacter sp. BJN0012]|uniref:hypothetical protein n=1 Tax=Caproicibacter sp. BJN0012 TaxID=3110227 RepID=UPI002E108F4E